MARQADIRGNVIETSRELFFQYGFSKVTTDEIAAAAGISKKTLYQYFESKESLFWEVMSQAMQEVKDRVEEVMTDEGLDFATKLRRIIELRAEQLNRIKQPLVLDVQRSFPALWKRVEELRRTELEAHLDRLVDQGVREGVFRPDIDKRMLEMVYMSAITGIINPERLSRIPYTAEEATDAIMRIVFTGVLTDEARREFPGAGGKRHKRKATASGRNKR
jgi:AcrR family transcriptional regulator